ncbi:hypothetical protein [Agrobacterium larrymoorei]|uniref:hypothetical protein n=1 Tax=Agrobacterium larrymoorei TaxID=160699 RepID=UPI0030BFF3CB
MSKRAARLDARISETFAGDETSQAIAVLLQEVQQASTDVGATGEASEQRVLNPRLRPAEVDATRKGMEEANFRSSVWTLQSSSLPIFSATQSAEKPRRASRRIQSCQGLTRRVGEGSRGLQSTPLPFCRCLIV